MNHKEYEFQITGQFKDFYKEIDCKRFRRQWRKELKGFDGKYKDAKWQLLSQPNGSYRYVFFLKLEPKGTFDLERLSENCYKTLDHALYPEFTSSDDEADHLLPSIKMKSNCCYL